MTKANSQGFNASNSSDFSTLQEDLLETAEEVLGKILLDGNSINILSQFADNDPSFPRFNAEIFPLKRQKILAATIIEWASQGRTIDPTHIGIELNLDGYPEEKYEWQRYIPHLFEPITGSINIDQSWLLLNRLKQETPLTKEDKEYQCYQGELKQINLISDPSRRKFEIRKASQHHGISVKDIQEDLQVLDNQTFTPQNELVSLKDFLNQEFKPIEWLYPGLLPKGELVLLTARPKVGKTLLATDLMFAVLSGEPYHGHDVPQGKVLYFWGDEPNERSVRRRLESAGLDYFKDDDNLMLQRYLHLNNLAALEEVLEAFRPTLVVIDSLTKAAEQLSISENEAVFARYIYKLNELLSRYGAAGILIHHDNKNTEQKGIDSVSGSGRITAAVWGVAQMKAANPENIKCTERFLSITPREGEKTTLHLDLNPGQLWSQNRIFNLIGEVGQDCEDDRSKQQQVLDFIKKYNGLGVEYSEINEALDMGRSLSVYLGRLLDKALIGRRRPAGKKRGWVYYTEKIQSSINHNPPPPPSVSPVELLTTNSNPYTERNSASQQVVNKSPNLVNKLSTLSQHPLGDESETIEKSGVSACQQISQQSPIQGGGGVCNTTESHILQKPDPMIGRSVRTFDGRVYVVKEAIEPGQLWRIGDGDLMMNKKDVDSGRLTIIEENSNDTES